MNISKANENIYFVPIKNNKNRDKLTFEAICGKSLTCLLFEVTIILTLITFLKVILSKNITWFAEE